MPPTQPSQRGANSSASRMPRRSTNACERCRRQKIRCSGQLPCDACSRRNLACKFNESQYKVLVTKGYIEELERKASQHTRSLSNHTGDNNSNESSGAAHLHIVVEHETEESSWHDAQSSTSVPRQGTEEPSTPRTSSGGPPLTNLLASGQPTFMTGGDGMTFYLGTSSNWSFTQKILSMVYEHLFHDPIPTQGRIFDGSAYDLNWNGIPTHTEPYSPALPTLDHAIYLINAVKFHCGQLFHVFDEQTFMPNLYKFYEKPDAHDTADKLWYVHFMLILAFGKAFTNKRSQGRSPPGVEYFTKALQLLPSIIMLWRLPVQSVEVMTCIALYLQCLDYRIAAHNFVGQALRLALNQGLHTDMPTNRLGADLVERSRRAWWTVYILDREMTSVAGLPQTIQDDDIHAQLPVFSGSDKRTTAFKMQVKLSQVLANINRAIYRATGSLDSRFSATTKNALAEVAAVADELRQAFPIQLERRAEGLSRTAAHLHLEYHRCVILATRPLLFCFLNMRLENKDNCFAKLDASETARNIVQMCLDSSFQIIMILESLLSQSLLDAFMPFDLDSISVATINIIVSAALDSRLILNGTRWLQQSHEIFDDLIASGNQVAILRKSELEQLADMLNDLDTITNASCMTFETTRQQSAANEQILSVPSLPEVSLPFDMNLEVGSYETMTTANIMDLANSVGNIDTTWMSQVIRENTIW